MTTIWLFQRHVNFAGLHLGWVRVSNADATTLIGDGVAQDGWTDVRVLKHITNAAPFDPGP